MFKKREADPVEKELDERIMDSFKLIDELDTKDKVQEELDKQILQLFELMENLTAYDEQYDKMASAVTKLMQLRKNKTEEHANIAASCTKLVELRKQDTISMETWATVGANLAGILLLMNHERAHVIASKAFSLIKKIV